MRHHCYEFWGDVVINVAYGEAYRNETILQYLWVIWQNIITGEEKIEDIRDVVENVKGLLEA